MSSSNSESAGGANIGDTHPHPVVGHEGSRNPEPHQSHRRVNPGNNREENPQAYHTHGNI